MCVVFLDGWLDVTDGGSGVGCGCGDGNRGTEGANVDGLPCSLPPDYSKGGGDSKSRRSTNADSRRGECRPCRHAKPFRDAKKGTWCRDAKKNGIQGSLVRYLIPRHLDACASNTMHGGDCANNMHGDDCANKMHCGD